mgnify:FL=1
MTQQFQIDGAGDIVLDGGNLVLVDDVAQRVTTRLRMLFGEWFLATSDGTPYLQQILIKNPNVAHVRAALRDRVLGTPGVRELRQFDLDFDLVRRKLSVDMLGIGPSGTFEVVL